MSGSDLDLSIESVFDADIFEEGSLIVDARIFADIVRKLPDDVCEVSVNEKNNVTIKCLNADYKIVGLNAEEFPQMPQVEIKNSITLSSKVLKEIISKTLFAVSLDNARKILTGSLYEIENGTLTVAAVDGYRLALTKKEVNSEW